MAYRQLFAVVLAVSGLAIVGCGKGDTNVVLENPDISDQPPSSSDQPPGNDDQPPLDPDQPSSNPDAPPGGGNLTGLCRQLCERLNDLTCDGDSLFGEIETQGCDQGCVIPPGVIPCEAEFAGLFQCILDLPSLCDLDDQQNQSTLSQCEDAAEAFGGCADAYEAPDDNQPEGCFPQGGCQCDNDCSECACENADNPMACVEECIDQ